MSLDSLIAKLDHQLNHYQPSHKKIVLGLSGGLDSRVLLQLLAQWAAKTPQLDAESFQIVAVHVHHGLSKNADQWAALCKNWCEALSIEFVCEHVVLAPEARTSLEQQAREARYDVLAKHVDASTLLITAHHADDQLETFLLALKRGSGPKGLSSMAHAMPFHAGMLLRPLLDCDRSELEEYAASNNLQWIEDESNLDTRFDRNFLRHQIIPRLKSRWPQIAQQASKSAELCAQQQQLLDELLQPIYERCTQENELLIEPLLQQTAVTQKQIVRMWFARQQRLMPSQKVLDQILTQVVYAKEDASPIVEIERGQLRRYQAMLYIIDELPDLSGWQQKIAPETWIELPAQQGWLGIFKEVPQSTDSNYWVGDIDASVDLSGLSLTYNSTGLYAKPVGRSGSRKLKKLWQEYSVPPWLRQQYPILQQQQNVIAVVGLFMDQRFCGTGYKVIWKKGH
jgi:tRNA(Ile)-lysidine synthase